MGYTHYIYVREDTPAEKLEAVVPDLIELIEATKVPLADGMGTPGTDPRISIRPAYVAFNGVGADGHETFMFPPNMGEGSYRPASDPGKVFDFCKTARKPYDAVVVACLLRIEKVVGSPWVDISSDAGSIDEFMGNEISEGWAQVNAMLGHPSENVLDETASQLYGRVFNEPPPIPACFKEEAEV